IWYKYLITLGTFNICIFIHLLITGQIHLQIFNIVINNVNRKLQEIINIFIDCFIRYSLFYLISS
ncbi:MAG: hypothetical protein IJ997_04070, partial [Mycoplasmataceae bacterium]|nr:hypothetical protein [Mycoplasmataceae bacterium]